MAKEAACRDLGIDKKKKKKMAKDEAKVTHAFKELIITNGQQGGKDTSGSSQNITNAMQQMRLCLEKNYMEKW